MPVAAPAANTSATGAGALQVRRTNDSAQAAVELAVVPPAGRTSGPIRVVQGGRELTAKTEPLVSGRSPLAIVVQVQPHRLAQAQALVGDALAELPLDARVAVAPMTGSGTGAPDAAQDPSTALSDLFRLAAEPSASALASTSTDITARSGARALLVLTTCPGSQRPDVGSSATTAWVLGWGGGCRDAGPQTSSGQVARRAKDLPAALDALPGLMAQLSAARWVRVEPQGAQPLVVTAAGQRATVALGGGSSGGSGAGAAEALARSDGAPAAAVQPGSPWWQGLPTRLGLGVLAAAALLVAVERRRRRPAVAPVAAPRRPASQDDPWGRLVPEWTRTRPRSAEPEASPTARSGGLSDARLPRPATGPADPASDGGPGVIDLREPAQERPEVR